MQIILVKIPRALIKIIKQKLYKNFICVYLHIYICIYICIYVYIWNYKTLTWMRKKKMVDIRFPDFNLYYKLIFKTIWY